MDPNLRAFKQQIFSFIDELEILFPNEKKIKAYKEIFEACYKANPRQTCNKYWETVSPYREEILNQNKQFFQQCDISSETKEAKDALYFREIINKSDLDDEDLKPIWDYLAVLCVLSERVYNNS